MKIFVRPNQQEFGPYSKKDVQEELRRGTFTPQDDARLEGVSEYKPLGDLLRESNGGELGKKKAASPVPITRIPPKKRPAILSRVIAVGVVAGTIYVGFSPSAADLRNRLANLAEQYFKKPQPEKVAPPPVKVEPIVAVPPIPEIPKIPEIPAPAPEITPPQPAGFDPAKLAQNPNEWPKNVRLLEDVEFPAIMEGRQVGKIKVQARQFVQLVKIAGENLTLGYMGGQAVVSWKKTNLEEAAAETAMLAASNPQPSPTPAAPTPPVAATAPTAPTSSGSWLFKQTGPNFKTTNVDTSSMLESFALDSALRKSKYQLTPEVKNAYLRFSKAKALKVITNSQTVLPADFLWWVDSDPIVRATVYGARKDAAGILCVLRSLELDLGRDAVRRDYTQLALAVAVAEAPKGADADLNRRNPLQMVISGDPRQPVDTHAKNRKLDQNDHIINFMEDHALIDGDTFGPNERPPELKYDSSGVAIIEGSKIGKGEKVTTVKRKLVAADIIARKSLQDEFNAYMETHRQPARVDCGDGVLVPNQHEMVSGPYAAKIKEAYKLFREAYEAKGRLPQSRDPFATPAERCAFLIRNDAHFPRGKDGHKKWNRFPVKTAPWPTMTLFAQANEPLREREEIWQRFEDKGEAITYGEYIGGIAQQYDFQSARRLSPYPFTYGSFQMMMKDGGVCGTMANMSVKTHTALGSPACTAGQPGHCALIVFDEDAKGNFFRCHGEQYATGEDDDTHPHGNWVFGDADSRRDMVWHQSVAYGVNAGFESYLDSMIALQIYKNQGKGVPKAERLALIQSGLAANPYNLALVEAAVASDDERDNLTEIAAFLKKTLESRLDKPGTPTKGLYPTTVAQLFEKHGVSVAMGEKKSESESPKKL